MPLAVRIRDIGEVKIWNVADGSLIRTIQGHKDAIYSMALIARREKFWPQAATIKKSSCGMSRLAKKLKRSPGHNGCVYGLAFRPDGKILASASGDRR